MLIDNPILVAKNYTTAIEESGLDISQSEAILLESIHNVFGSATQYKNFESNLLKGLLDENEILENDTIRDLLGRQRQVILEDTTVMASPEAMSFCSSFIPNVN